MKKCDLCSQRVDTSAANVLLSELQFRCPICLDVFTNPVTITCGHNFCKNCITIFWDVSDQYKCAMCQKVFDIRPQLHINTLLAEVVAQFRRSSELKKTNEEIQQMIEERQLKMEQIQKAADLSEENADRAIKDATQFFTSLKESIERSLQELTENIEQKKRRVKTQAEESIKELQQELSVLLERSSEVEQLSNSQDHLHTHQDIEALKDGLPTKDWAEVCVCPLTNEGIVGETVAKLRKTLTKDMRKWFVDELKRVKQYYVDLTLDPETAHPDAVLSGGRKIINYSKETKKDGENVRNPKTFSAGQGVLAEQSFSSGKFYYEICTAKVNMAFGVVRESSRSKEVTPICPENGYWAINLRGTEGYALDEPLVPLSLESASPWLGVFVDHDQGLVSFYHLQAASLIYSFSDCDFNGSLRPFFSPSVM
ncbi:E3 ubiquitin-protein ligase TRIM39-like [Aulostomus maculatus]